MKRIELKELNWYKVNKDLNSIDKTMRKKILVLRVLAISAVIAAFKLINKLLGE
jgi:hypothetical protein